MHNSTFRLYFRVGVLLFASLYFSIAAVAQVGVPKEYRNGMVVSAKKEASDVGIAIMKKGGNAIDAAVASHFALAVVFPAAGNLGGGGFMVVRMDNGEINSLDFRETAPKRAHKNMYIDRKGEVNTQAYSTGFTSVGVPGSVDGMIVALERYGTMPLDVVIEPSIKLARDGFRLSYEDAKSMNRAKETFLKDPGASKYFVKPDQTDWQEGDLFVQSDLAETLERIAQLGRTGFYSGVTADMMVADMKKHGGYIDYTDLRSYESVWRKPVVTRYKEYELIMMGPPSSGGIVISQLLHMMEPYQPGSLGFNTVNYVHLFTEAARRAYADRNYFIGDPDFNAVPTPILISKDYNHRRMSDFSWEKASTSREIGHGDIPFFQEPTETTHLSVVDQRGNAVSITTTLNSGFGAKVAVQGAGFLLNNEMNDFTAKPGTPNQFGLVEGKMNSIKANKRMLSSMSPTIVTQNRSLRMVLGTPGGSVIPTTVLQVFLNVAEHGMNIQQAVAAPRIHHQWLPDELVYDAFAFPPQVNLALQALGHATRQRTGYIGRADCIFIRTDGILEGGADPRGEDYVSGW